MNIDKHDEEIGLSSLPGEFKQNCLFLSELINCKGKNDSATGSLESAVDGKLPFIQCKLNRRQLRILSDFIEGLESDDPECFCPPVPEELEAAIRSKRRSTWLPWEAEAIHKIETWRRDISSIAGHLTSTVKTIRNARQVDASADPLC